MSETSSDTSSNTSQPDRPDHPPQYTADDPIIQDLASLLVQSAYACGGSVLVKKRTKARQEGVTSPVAIRWDAAEQLQKLILPEADQVGIQSLIKSTQPASFGFKGKDVIDESYRKASKLDPSAFSTNFCPYVAGIIDTIGQALLPLPDYESQGIRAQLYKLNVYEGPSGMFKPHLDTPRSDLHFGSLVVCLPSTHDGGQLVVRHQGHSTTFDWSKDSSNVQWAAFYGDCEHEVFEVTSGYRVTLTYNLFLRRGLGEMAVVGSALDAAQLPAYREVQAALANPLFFPDGGLLGKYCSHAYAHATNEGIRALPATLKGSDMVTYKTFKSLGIKVDVRPTLDLQCQSEWFEGSFWEYDHIGKKLSEPIGSIFGLDGGITEETFEPFPQDKLKVKWLNKPVADTKNVQYSYVVYGNEAETEWAYSFCVLLMTIPPYSERVKSTEKPSQTIDGFTTT